MSLFFSLALCVYDAMEFQSGAALYSLSNGIQIISTRCCLLYTLYVRSFSRISTDNNLFFLSLSLSCDDDNKHVICTKGSKR